MGIVLAAPLAVPWTPPPAEPLLQTWTGFDGSEWVLSDWSRMPSLRPGVTGLHMPRMTVYSSSTPLVDGAELTGYTIPPRPVYWPLVFKAGSVAEWRDLYAGFFDSVHPVEPGTWTVGEGRTARSMQLTGTFDDDFAFQYDPFLTGFAQIGVDLVAPRPLWLGEPVVVPFTGGDPVNFIDENESPPFHISSEATFTDARITNTGNEPAYIEWTVSGPLTGVTVGVGGALVSAPDLVEGDVLVINTDPAGQYATLNGSDYTKQLGFQMFAPVPAKKKSSLVVAGTGSGTVVARIQPRFWRAV